MVLDLSKSMNDPDFRIEKYPNRGAVAIRNNFQMLKWGASSRWNSDEMTIGKTLATLEFDTHSQFNSELMKIV